MKTGISGHIFNNFVQSIVKNSSYEYWKPNVASPDQDFFQPSRGNFIISGNTIYFYFIIWRRKSDLIFKIEFTIGHEGSDILNLKYTYSIILSALKAMILQCKSGDWTRNNLH